MDDCGYEPVYFSSYSEEFCGAEVDAGCDGFIKGDPGEYLLDRCKVRLGLHWLHELIPASVANIDSLLVRPNEGTAYAD
jgi:hypothetical protein